MILFPAIDIKDGKVVRLVQGQFDKMTEYSTDPLEIAHHWVNKGARWLHIVDLDGALTGQVKNKSIVLKIARYAKVPIQMGGGVRDIEVITELIEGGVSRVILGTKVIEDRYFLKEVLSRFPEKIAVSLDCSNGMVAQRGWTDTSDIKATDFAQELEDLGLRCLVYTDIARDGMLTGPNLAGLKEILKVTNIPVIASGGIANLDDIRELLELESEGVMGAITGKAIYEGKLDLTEALELCSPKG